MAAQDLTTLTAVRRFLQKSATDTAQDDEIGYMITSASDAIMRYCQREFKSTASPGTVRKFEYRGNGYLDLAPFDLRSVTLIRMDPDLSSPYTVNTAEYRLYPQHVPQGVYTAIRLDPVLAYTASRWAHRIVEVTGTWGFASVPSEVEHATILTVNTWLKSDVTAYESVLSVDQTQLDRPAGIPSRAQQILAPFVRTGI